MACYALRQLKVPMPRPMGERRKRHPRFLTYALIHCYKTSFCVMASMCTSISVVLPSFCMALLVLFGRTQSPEVVQGVQDVPAAAARSISPVCWILLPFLWPFLFSSFYFGCCHKLTPLGWPIANLVQREYG